MGELDQNKNGENAQPLDDIDAGWDDDTSETAPESAAPALSGPPREPDVLDRPTVVPGIPFEQYAQEMMSYADPDAESPSGVHERATPVFVLDASEIHAKRSDAPNRARQTADSRGPSQPAASGFPSSEAPTMRRPTLDDGPPSQRPTTAPRRSAWTLDELDPPLATSPPDCFSASTAPPPAGEFPSIEVEEAAPNSEDATESALLDMRDRHAMGDYSGALDVAESILEVHPYHAEAAHFVSNCRQMLIKMASARIGRLDRQPTLLVSSDQIRWLSLDHRAGFMLSLLDGHSTVEEILDICGMDRLDALKILQSLIEQRVIGFES
jgi:hypothetical protein